MRISFGPALLHRRAERDPHLGGLLRAAEEAPEGRDPRSDRIERAVEEGPGLPHEAVGHPETLEQLQREPQRQAHHPEEVAADPLDERRPAPLDRVGARFVERLSGGDVVRDHLLRQGPERHVGDVDGVLHALPLRHGHGRHHLVRAPLEPLEHRHRLLGRARLPEHLLRPQHDRGVRRQHHRLRLPPRDGEGLVARDAHDVAVGDLARLAGLARRGDDHAKGQAEHREQLPPPRAAAREDQAVVPAGRAHFSRISVTGPSFTSSTSIIAPNSPVSTFVPPPRSRNRATNRSYSGTASAGGAASTKLGRRPLWGSPYRVNCDTTSSAPPTSSSARFIFPAVSPNTRSVRIFSAIHSSVGSVSVGANPASTTNPTPIPPTTLPSMRTSARETRCKTTRTAPPPP